MVFKRNITFVNYLPTSSPDKSFHMFVSIYFGKKQAAALHIFLNELKPLHYEGDFLNYLCSQTVNFNANFFFCMIEEAALGIVCDLFRLCSFRIH